MADEPFSSPSPARRRRGAADSPQGREFLGSGWRFPAAFELGGVAMSAYEAKVAEAIRIVLGTSRGERVMRPDFGCGIHELVFEPATESTLALIRAAVREALVMWEPRIELLDVQIEAAPGQSPRRGRQDATGLLAAGAREGMLIIGIDYRVRSTNNEFNLVYPFYLSLGA
jgi:phage baseplate assembly protein W